MQETIQLEKLSVNMAKDKKDSSNNLDSGNISKITMSSSSVKSKKSNSFFATIKRVMKKKSKSSDTTLKNLHVGSAMYSSSSLALNSEGKRSVFGDLQEITEVEHNCLFYNENMGDNIVNFHPVDKISDSGTSCFVETIKSDTKLVPKSKSLRKGTIESKRDILEGLELAQELAKKLKESENNFIQVLTKYITDPGVLQDLLDVVALHTKLFMETDRRTSSVINLIWTQKLDGWQKQERELKESLSLLVKENRDLHIKNEQLFRKSEMFSKKLHNYEESQTKKKDKLERKCSCNKQLTNLLKHNEKLEEKLRGYYQQLEDYENKLAVSQIQSSILETEVRTSNGEVQLLKAKLERTRTDFNLEIVSLNVKLLSNEKIIRETIEVGDNILEDLGRIKINLKKTPLVTIDWAKLKFRGNTPVDIMALCRLYLEELSRELYALVERIKQNQAIIESLEKKNESLRNNLEAVQIEISLLTEKSKESMQNSLQISDLEGKIRTVEEDYKFLENEISKNKADYDEKVKAFNELVASYETVLKEIKDKEDVILKQNLEIEKIHQENCSLKSEVNSLQKILKEMGSGDNNKLRVEFPKVQSEYFQLLNDKQELLRQIETLREDNRVLLSNQQKYYEYSQKHKGEVQDLNKELQIFKHKLAVEHQTLVSLQKERKKYLEEKSTLKTIFQHMKSEIDRMQKLEGTVLDISKEANRLAVIADFNKKIGEKLKEEVVNRDNTINELRDTMERLNIIQVENTKEKLSLCHELSEVCNIKDQLSDVLTQEVQKNYRLYETNKDLENTAQSQAIKFQEKELTEKEALKEIFEELKKVVLERDTLMTQQEKYIKEIKELENNFLNVQKKFDMLNAKYNKKDHKLVQLTESIKTTETSFQKTEHKLAKEILEYKNKVALMEKQNEQSKEEKLELQNTISYLKNNSQKLHNDLNEARSHEKNIKDQLYKTELDLKTSKMENSKLLEKIVSLTTDKEKLISEIEYVNNLCEKVLADFETNIKSANEKEETHKKEMDESQRMIKKYEVDMEVLRKELELCRSQYPAIVTTDSPTDQNKLIFILEKENNSLRREIFLKEDALKQLNADFKKKVLELNNVQKKFKDANDKKEKEISDLKKRVSNMEEKHKEETNILNQEIRKLNKQIADLNETLQKERKDHIPAQIYNELTAKYLTCNAELMDKNQALQEVLRTLQETQTAMSSIQREKEEMRDQINKTLDSLSREKQYIQKLTKEKEDLSRQFGEVSTKCSILETELKDYSQSELDSTKIEYLKSTENRANLLKKELDESYDVIVSLKEELSGFQQQVASLEFEMCELKLRLHESQGNLESEKAISQQLREANHQTLFAILQMRDDGKVGPLECSELLVKLESAVAQNPANLNSVDSSVTPNL